MGVDVVIPVYNGARFVRRAVASVLAQDVPGTRVHLIDDCSTDDSLAVLTALAADDDRVRVLRNDSNRGVSISRNSAIAQCSAQYLALLDQDDAWPLDKLAKQLEVLENHPEVGYVVGKQHMILETGGVRPSWCRPEWLLAPQAGYIPGTLLVRRSVFLQIGYFDESMRTGGDDTDWFARARRLKVPHVALDDVLLQRYVHETNLSSQESTNNELLSLVRRHVRESDREA